MALSFVHTVAGMHRRPLAVSFLQGAKMLGLASRAAAATRQEQSWPSPHTEPLPLTRADHELPMPHGEAGSILASKGLCSKDQRVAAPLDSSLQIPRGSCKRRSSKYWASQFPSFLPLFPNAALDHRSRSFSSGADAAHRSSSFGEVSEDDLEYFRGVVGTGAVVTDEDALKVANTDWMNKYHGKSKLLLRPKTTEQVSHILKYCNDRRLAVVPQGGNSGLVGGSVPLFDEVILNLGAMDQIVSFDDVSGILVCEAGCILENVDSYLSERGHVFPLDLGAKGSCQIGGNISTNAGGLRLLRYGSLHGTVLGLEVVLADGTVIDTLKTLRKDNTGYDLKQLFIGGEGSLGVVTKAAILTPPKARSVHVALLACSSFQDALKTFKVAKQELGEILSAFEFFDRTCLDLVLKHQPGVRDPLPPLEEGAPPHPFYLLVETAGSNEEHDSAKWDMFLEAASSQGGVENGTVAQDASQASGLWGIRESITESLSKNGVVYKYDLSLPVKDLYKLVEETQERIADMGVAVGYGHMGDGNLHLNVSAPTYSNELLQRLEPFVYEWTSQRTGSISAEHGLGQMKAEALHYSKSESAVKVMADLKRSLDPHGILNPYKVLPLAASQQ